MKIEVLNHASVKLSGEKIIYVDPYEVEDDYHDANYIFITHDHYDHYDEASIQKIKNESTKIIVPTCLKDKVNNLVVEPDKDYVLDEINFKTVSSYNIGKDFHPKFKKYVGYIINLDGNNYYIMGDTDVTKEAKNVHADTVFVPIGGKFTMDVDEAIKYINELKPRKAIPIHYGKIVGDKSLGDKFKNNINKEIEVEILI